MYRVLTTAGERGEELKSPGKVFLTLATNSPNSLAGMRLGQKDPLKIDDSRVRENRTEILFRIQLL